MRSLLAAPWCLGLAACVGCRPCVDEPPMSPSEIPFTHVAHAIVVPVRLGLAAPADGALETRFVFDTGIGLNVVTKALCARLRCATSGEVRGRRMSGQELVVPTSSVRSLSVGDAREEDVRVGVFDVALPPAFAGIDGFLSPAFFERRPFTIDYARKTIVLETPASLAAREAAGVSVPLTIDRESGTLTLFLRLDVGVGEPALVEVDTGSDALILHTRYLAALGLDPAGPDVKTATGTDETGHAFVRRFARMPRPVFPAAAPTMRVEGSPVMFQDVIHDGLVGHAYFKHFVVTYDLPRARLLFARP